MHTSRELSAASFAITVDGRAADLDAVLPGFTERDRVGVVVRRPLGGAGASLLVLAAVTGFYEEQRRRGEPFFIYPDYFVFHAGRPLGDHRKLDIWPSHKEVVVEPTSRRRSCGRSTTGRSRGWWWRTTAATAPRRARRSSRARRSRARAGASRLASPTPPHGRAPGARHRDRRQRGHGALRDRAWCDQSGGAAVRGAGLRGGAARPRSGTAGPSRPTGRSRSTRRSRGSADERTARTPAGGVSPRARPPRRRAAGGSRRWTASPGARA